MVAEVNPIARLGRPGLVHLRRLRGNLIVLMFACWKIHVRETAEIGLQHNHHVFLISDPNIAIVQLLCHQKIKKLK